MADIKYTVLVDTETGAITNIGRKSMAKNGFIWKAGDTYTRSKSGTGGAHLEQGKSYDAAAFDPEVIAEWVRAGAAEYTGGKKAGKED